MLLFDVTFDENDMADEGKRRRGCLRRTVLLIKISLVLLVLGAVAVAGGAAGVFIERNNNKSTVERLGQLESRTSELSTTVTELENQNNTLIAENQELKDKLRTEAEKLEAAKKVNYRVIEVGKRLMAVDIEKPKVYLEFDRNYGNPVVEAYPAEFSKDVIASGIEISFPKSAMQVVIEPWKIRGRGLEQVESFKTTTADGKEAIVSVLKEAEGKFVINGTVAEAGNSQDSLKVLISLAADNASKQNAIDEVRSVLRSMEINFDEL